MKQIIWKHLATNLFLVVKDLSFCMLGLLEDFPLEVTVSQSLRDVHSTDIQLGLGGNNIDLVDTPQWASIDMVGTCQTPTLRLYPHLVHVIMQDQCSYQWPKGDQTGAASGTRLSVKCHVFVTKWMANDQHSLSEPTFPLCLPATRIRTVPGVMLALIFLLCWEKGFLWVLSFHAFSCVGYDLGCLLTATFLLPPFLSPLICFSTNFSTCFLGMACVSTISGKQRKCSSPYFNDSPTFVK